MKNNKRNQGLLKKLCIIGIPDPRRKRILSLKDEIVSLFKTKTSKQAVCGRGIKQKTI